MLATKLPQCFGSDLREGSLADGSCNIEDSFEIARIVPALIIVSLSERGLQLRFDNDQVRFVSHSTVCETKTPRKPSVSRHFCFSGSMSGSCAGSQLSDAGVSAGAGGT